MNGRPVSRRIKVTGSLVLRSTLHVGSRNEDYDVDMPLARDARGRHYVPGTSLAGPFREWARRVVNDEQLLNRLWGFQPDRYRSQRGNPDDPTGAASWLLIEDAYVVGESQRAPTEVWDSVGIDRETGVAAVAVKYEREVLPKGTELKLRMALEIPDLGDPRVKALIAEPNLEPVLAAGDDEAMAYIFMALVEALEGGQIRIGARKTSGLGRVVLRNTKIVEESWNSKSGVLDIVKARAGLTALPSSRPKAPRPVAVAKIAGIPRLRCVVDWGPLGPLMVKAPYSGTDVDALPMMSSNGSGKLTMVIPGDSMKGALRSRAEKIIRTVAEEDFPFDRQHPGNEETYFLNQIDVALVRNLFGTRKRALPEGGSTELSKAQKDADARLGLGALSVSQCLATNVAVSTQAWQHVVDAPREDNALYTALSKGGLRNGKSGAQFDQAHHVAIDRWTGGAAEHLLYSGIEPYGVSWEPLELEIDLGRFSSCTAASDQAGATQMKRDAAIALLFLTLRDMAQGWVTIGFGSNRGYGEVEVRGVTFAVEGCDDGVAGLAGSAQGDQQHSNAKITLSAQELVDPAVLASNDDAKPFVEAINNAWVSYLKDELTKEQREVRRLAGETS